MHYTDGALQFEFIIDICDRRRVLLLYIGNDSLFQNSISFTFIGEENPITVHFNTRVWTVSTSIYEGMGIVLAYGANSVKCLRFN